MTRSKKTRAPYDSFEINDGPAVRLANLGALVAILGVGALVAWMVLTPVDEVAKARGTVEPVTEVQRLQTEFGGALSKIHVRKGDLVEAFDPIVSFDTAEAASELREARAKELALLLERERLAALVEERDPQFEMIARAAGSGATASSVHRPGSHDADDRLRSDIQAARRESAALTARRAFLENERQVIDRQIAEKEADLAAIAEERPAVQRQLAVAAEDVETVRDLVDRGLAPRPRFVEAVEAEARFNYDLASLTGRETVLKAEIAELMEAQERIGLNEAAEARARISQINGELPVVAEQIVRLVRRVNATELRAPVAGFVQTIPDTAVGRVFESGGLVAEIVPKDVELRFAGQLLPRDVGFVTRGQPVRLKIDAFDFSRYGALDGKVSEISPTTIVDERGNAFYEILVSLDKTYFRDDPDAFALLPGMTGEGDVLTGKKTVFEYVWKPIYTNLDLAFAER
ncbi:HlyD family type I secretion periplasmic adaptor subunit [Acuticoccus sp. MNP-M23]|uniref:HlyD family type I secretion periplasmic adaptor subunit n=1 Tax=Acuticoccus sp. MNP-M23 TaxID=3072793 RepID=UPI002814FDDB|nr:HlyD family type I secretion periplasmic adaptor subunit [Acuticoccus sp. MNP-M23]WMS41326.1 HlyD family type I secretion periplasmic adaptor subunit [Acuticoccus sp. MNP-M23]